MTPRLSNTQPITVKGDIPHMELLIFIARLADYIDALEARISALEALHP